jgi:hypothetical protein
MLHLKRLVMFMEALKQYALEWKEQTGKTDKSQVEVMTVADLLGRLGRKISGMNLLEIEGYLRSSKVASATSHQMKLLNNKSHRLQGRFLVIQTKKPRRSSVTFFPAVHFIF